MEQLKYGGLTINNLKSGINMVFVSPSETSLVKIMDLIEVNISGGNNYCGRLVEINREEGRDSCI